MKVQGSAVLILPDEIPEKTKGGIIVSPASEPPKSGKVVDCGPGCKLVKVGDQVQYHRKGASIIVIEDTEHHFIIEEQVFYVH